MTKKEFREKKKNIKKLLTQGDSATAESIFYDLMENLYNDKKYSEIVDLYHSGLCDYEEHPYNFEIAYSLNNLGYKDDAENVYEIVIKESPDNSSALNNLSNIKKEKGHINLAYDLVKKAFDLEPKDEIIANNFNTLSSIVRERQEIENNYKHAIITIEKENDFVINKLKTFINNFRKEKTLKNGKLPIPRWKFKILMGTDEQKANSLLIQWIDKGYLRKTGDRGDYHEHIYEINPYLAKKIYGLKPTKINPKWIDTISELTSSKLEELSYFEIISKISKVKRKFKDILVRDIDELFINYIMKNHKTVIILSGSIVETALIYYCEKKKISQINYQTNKKTISKKLYDCDLGDLLSYCEQNKLLGNVIMHMGNLSRIYRNFVHPGKELRETEILSQSKANLCFSSTIEILQKIA